MASGEVDMECCTITTILSRQERVDLSLTLFPGVESATGLGDINQTNYFSPSKPGGLIWGIGPTFTLPTASDRLLGRGKWSMVPAAVALSIQGPWVFGALTSNQWSFAG